MPNIAVIGDSHSRIFAHTNIFTPFFLGSGGQYNLGLGFYNLFTRLKSSLSKIKNDFDYIALLLGEPVSRYQLEKEDLIHKKYTDYSLIKPSIDEEILNIVTGNFHLILDFAKQEIQNKLLIFAPISVFKPSLNFSIALSLNMKELCEKENVPFFDVKDYIINNNEVDETYKAEPVHANQNVLPFFGKMLKDKKIIDCILELNHKENFYLIRDRFKYNERFGCFCM